MRLLACIVLLFVVSACATSAPYPRASAARSARFANLQRAAELPWRDGGRCVVREASQPWPVLVERCFHSLDHERVRFNDPTGRCAVASVGAAGLGIGLCVLAAPELVVGAVVIAGVVVVGVAIQEALEAYELKRGRPEVRPAPETRPAPEARRATHEPSPKQEPKPEPAGQDWFPPVPPESLERERHPKCEPIPVKHRGGDDAHNKCADRVPPNRYPGMDVLIDGKHFDALQVGVRVLWEIKTDQFDTYSDFLQEQVVKEQIGEFEEERSIAQACGYGFVVGVSTEAHKVALKRADRGFNVVVTGCKR
ncbi:DUF6310 domain-containing protein [Myxococcaceae bacterium GXIMD 01537]